MMKLLLKKRRRSLRFDWPIGGIIALLLSSVWTTSVDGQGCGHQIQNLTGELTHPEYPDDYGENANCQWTTIARDRDQVFFQFDLLDLEADRNGRCSYDFVSIQFPSESDPEKFCGRPQNRDPDEEVKKNGTGDPVIKLVSDESVQFKGFLLKYSIERFDYCESSPCKNAGSCVLDDDKEEGWKCECASGWTGEVCDEDLDECDKEPCQNSGTCSTPEFDMYSCACAKGFTGDSCETNIDECGSSPCLNDGSCQDDVDGYSCQCSPGYTGPHCETEIDECQSNPCENNGECHDGINSFTCQCSEGYEGSSCEIDIDECSSTPCHNNATCSDDVNRFDCACAEGYQGTLCQDEIDECSSNPCQNGASCTDDLARYSCVCVDGFTNTHCDMEMDECDSDPCQNDAPCVDHPGAYECLCGSGFSGVNCEVASDDNPTEDGALPEILSCDPNPCKNGGSCTESEGKAACQCVGGYTGKVCQNIEDKEHWHHDVHLLSIILPSLLFLLLGIIFAILFFYFFRKKRKRSTRVQTIKVKPNKDSRKSKKQNPRDKRKKQHRKKKKKHDILHCETDSDTISVIDDASRRPVAYIGNISKPPCLPPKPMVVAIPTAYPDYQNLTHHHPIESQGIPTYSQTQPGLYESLAPKVYDYPPNQTFPNQNLHTKLPVYQPTSYPCEPPYHQQHHHRDEDADFFLPDREQSESDQTEFSKDDKRNYVISEPPAPPRRTKKHHKPISRINAEYKIPNKGIDSPPESDAQSVYDRNTHHTQRSLPASSLQDEEETYLRNRSEEFQETKLSMVSEKTHKASQRKVGHWQDRDDKKLNCFPSSHKCYQAAGDPGAKVKKPNNNKDPMPRRNRSKEQAGRQYTSFSSVKSPSENRKENHNDEKAKFGKSFQEKLQRQNSTLSRKNNILSSGLRSLGLSKRNQQSKRMGFDSQIKSLTPIREDPLRESYEDVRSSSRYLKEPSRVREPNSNKVDSTMRHPPEGGISSSDEGMERKLEKKCHERLDKEDSKISFFKLIRKSNSLNINRGRGFTRENAFIQQ